MQATQIMRSLAEIDVFSSLPESTLQRLAEGLTQRSYQPGSLITEQGGDGSSFILITEGTADVEVNGVRKATLDEGDYLGEIALIDRQPRSASVRAGAGGTKVAELSALNFAPVLDDAAVCKGLLRTLCARLRAAEVARSSDS
jgi:CRP-like cAMP-binding protein